MRIFPLGDSALSISLGSEINLETHRSVMEIARYFDDHPIQGVIELIPSYSTVTLLYDPRIILYQELLEQVEEALHGVTASRSRDSDDSGLASRLIEIPVHYGGEWGPDLGDVARHTGLSPEKVIQLHSEVEYTVYMIGFAPGFPYLGGMNEKLATPRLDRPRAAIPAGSVGIAGRQTGVYPLSTPGGWRLIGYTPLELFNPQENPPTLLRAGDRVRFRPVEL